MVSVWGDLLYPQSLCLELPPGTFPQRPLACQCHPSRLRNPDPIQQQLKVFSCLTIMLFAHTGKTTSLVDWIPTFKCHSIAVASRSINARCYETERASRSCRRSRSTLKLQRISRFGDIKEGVCTAINDLACSSCYQPAPIPAGPGLLDRVIPVAPANWISACPLTHPFNAFPQ